MPSKRRGVRPRLPLLAALVLALLVGGGRARSQDPSSPTAAPPRLAELEGRWRVDLRPTPEAEPYYQEMIVSIDGEVVEGVFYGTAFRDFRSNADWGTLHFAFVTEDGSGVYHTAGRLVEGRLEGTTHALGRGFLAVWTAERAGDQPD